MSVVVIGLQHTQAPLPLLEAAAVPDADLHKTLSALSHRRNVQEAVVLSTCLRTEVYAVVDRFHDAVAEIYDVLSEQSGLLRRGAVGPCHRPLRRRRDLPPVLGDLGPRVGGDRGDRGGRPGAPRLRAGPGRRHLRPCPLRPLPPRAADGQAGADRDRHQQGHHLVRLRRRDRRPRGGPGRIARRPGRGGRRRRNGPRRLPRPVGHRAGGRAAACRRGEPLGGPGARPGAPDRDRSLRHAGGAARAASPASWPRPMSC